MSSALTTLEPAQRIPAFYDAGATTPGTVSVPQIGVVTAKIEPVDLAKFFATSGIPETPSPLVGGKYQANLADSFIFAAELAIIAGHKSPSLLLGDAWPNQSVPSDGRPPIIVSLDSNALHRFGTDEFLDMPDVDKATLSRATTCLSLLSAELPRPQTSSSPDGEVGLFWFRDENRVEAYFDPDGHLTWIEKFDGQFDRGGDVDWDGSPPAAFVRMLTRLYS
jgi:hypothetical protein